MLVQESPMPVTPIKPLLLSYSQLDEGEAHPQGFLSGSESIREALKREQDLLSISDQARGLSLALGVANPTAEEAVQADQRPARKLNLLA
jgi:hypothetical protein